MRILVFALVSVLCCGAACAAGTVPVDGLGSWSIVLADGASPAERYAAEELQRLLARAIRVELPIVSEAARKRGNIFVGPDAVRQAGRVRFAVDDLGEEGVRMRIKKHNIAIAGGRPRGTLYAVYTFCERYLGVRFLTWDHTFVPATETIEPIPCETFSYVPPFSFRWSYYRENSDRPDFAARLRVNTVTHDEKLGGATNQHLINHTLYKWINPAKYGDSHPEYFALTGGERKLEVGGGGPEPCVTNPDVIDIVAEGVIAELDANPSLRNISVSQNDNDAYCRCESCEAINQREGTPMGSQLALVNAVAERVEQKHPNVKVGTLAYWYTRQAPKTIKPRSNVQIQLCSIECCTLHAIDDPDCERNRKFCADMRAWKAICNDIWVWNYNTNFHSYDLPFPNLRSIGANVRFFLNNNVKGVFMQANGNGTSGEMSDLRNYVMARCIWDPALDSWDLVEEFCRLHYAESAPPILEYLTMLHDNAEARGLHPGCFPSVEEVGLDAGIAARALGYFDKALDLARSDEVRARVEKASICAYKAMVTVGFGKWTFADGVCAKNVPERYAGVTDRYIELCRKYNMSMASERMPANAYFEKLKRYASISAVRIENEVWRLTVLPEENGKLVEMFHKPTQRNLLAGITRSDILSGTHEEIAMRGLDGERALKFYAEVNGTAIRLSADLTDGSTVVRKIAFEPDEPGTIAFESSVIYRGGQPKTFEFKIHPEFDAGSCSSDADVVAAYIKDGAWIHFNQDWGTGDGKGAAVLDNAKGGAFAFYNHDDGFGVQVAYPPEQHARPRLWWHPPRGQINLELLVSTNELAPGTTATFNYTFQYLDQPPE
ncbi:MAG: DUF4838 domain-containing protein [Nitrospiraceae bacterium]|nr:DUF4838 domain-containing protein [Nitrospiraceae bacterium]